MCGKRLTPRSFKNSAIIISALISISLLAFLFSNKLIGEKPLVAQKVFSSTNEIDPIIKSLKAQALEDPNNLSRWQNLASAIQEKLSMQPIPSQDLIFELIESLRGILSISPKDKQALLAMGEISYSQQAFDKAAQFYGDYLMLNPDDDGTRANYASTLTFINRAPDAINELTGLLKRNPNNFQALAYLSIAHARNNDIPNAKLFGEKALKLAPDEEANQRFGKFLTSLDKPQDRPATATRGNLTSTSTPTTKGASVVESPKGKVLQFLSEHPILGPKLSGHEFASDGSLILTVHDFPIASMPPFARQKFEERLKAAVFDAKASEVKKVVFIDKGTLKELGIIAIQ